MKKKTAFRICAERFAEGIEVCRGCCNEINFVVNDTILCQTDETRWFSFYFYPNNEDIKNYGIDSYFWMETAYYSDEQNRNDRILALLICEQVWLSEQNENK